MEVEPASIHPLLVEVGGASSPPTKVETELAGIHPLLVEVEGAGSPPTAVETEPAGIHPLLVEVGAVSRPPTLVEAETAGIHTLLVEVVEAEAAPTALPLVVEVTVAEAAPAALLLLVEAVEMAEAAGHRLTEQQTTDSNTFFNLVIANGFLPWFSLQFGMPNYYFFILVHYPWRLGETEAETRVLRNVFLRIHSEVTRPIVPEDNTDLNVSTADLLAPYQPQGSLVHGHRLTEQQTTDSNTFFNLVIANGFLPWFSLQFGMPNYYFFILVHYPWRLGETEAETRVLRNVFLRIHSEATRPIVPEDNTDLNVSTADLLAPYQPQGSLVHGEPWIALAT
ncbi:UNVERIFIED_CONTAM: hypothetical protein FKN15_007874 [Acipenser sinensis]